MSILVSGSLAYDSIMVFPDYFKNHILPDKIHNINVSFLVDGLKVNYGGTAGNIAYSLALLGERPRVLATAGKDFAEYGSWLSKNGVDVSGIKIISEKFTALAHIVTDKGDNQITAFYPGAMKHSAGKLKKEFLKNSLAIISPGCLEDMRNYLAIYKKNKIPYIFDPGQQITILSKKELTQGISGAKVFISNDYELSLVTQKTGLDENDIINQVEILVTTLGEKGSVIKTKTEKYEIPVAKPKAVKDPTGAGDAYRSGFVKGLIAGLPLAKCGRLAAVVSAYTVETYGTQTHKFTMEDARRRYKQNFRENL